VTEPGAPPDGERPWFVPVMTAEGPDGAWGDNVQDDAEAASGNDAVEHDDAADDAAPPMTPLTGCPAWLRAPPWRGVAGRSTNSFQIGFAQ
jgi:hypothetical protein